MSVALFGDVLGRARTLLNDDDATNWPDTKLIPKAVQAFEELEADLILAGIPIINGQTIVLNVPAYLIFENNNVPFDLSTVPNYPTDMILPIWMKERQLGDQYRDFVDMVEVDFIPITDVDIYLRYWCWYQNTITLLGAFNPVQVMLRYQRFLPVPGVNTDSIVVPLGQLFLAYRIAALAADSLGDRQRRIDLTDQADKNLDRIIRMNIKQQQNLPTKRRPYHRGYGRNRVLRDF
jgi:hypothetical protein